jgi:hypothetical protein
MVSGGSGSKKQYKEKLKSFLDILIATPGRLLQHLDDGILVFLLLLFFLSLSLFLSFSISTPSPPLSKTSQRQYTGKLPRPNVEIPDILLFFFLQSLSRCSCRSAKICQKYK